MSRTCFPPKTSNAILFIRTFLDHQNPIKCIEERYDDLNELDCARFVSKKFDGDVSVNMLWPVKCRNFDNYVQVMIVQLHSGKTTNIVLDK